MGDNPCFAEQEEVFDSLDAYNKLAIRIGNAGSRGAPELSAAYGQAEARYDKALDALKTCKEAAGINTN